MNSNFGFQSLIFQAGDVIQDFCYPFMKILLTSQKASRCDECFIQENLNLSLRRCSGCKLMYYCSKECQKRDWSRIHKLECASSFFRDSSPSAIFPSEILQFKYRMLRLSAFIYLHPEETTKKYPIYNGSTRCFNDLMSHKDHTSDHPQILILCKEIQSKGDKWTANLDILLNLAGIFRTNAFCIYNDQKTEAIGSGIFIQTSVFDHSCKPTAYFAMKGVQMQIRAIAHIPVDQVPLVSYILANKGNDERKEILKRRYNFECQCERCICESKNSDVISYEKLNKLLQSQSTIRDWSSLLNTNKQIIGMLRKIYHEYDERITNQIHWIYTRGIEFGIRPKDEIFNEIREEAKLHILKTYGEDNSDYKKLTLSSK